MKRTALNDLNMNTREEVLSFLRTLWDDKNPVCPLCGNELKLLHSKAKKDDSDWQCTNCNRSFRSINLLVELNEKMPK